MFPRAIVVQNFIIVIIVNPCFYISYLSSQSKGDNKKLKKHILEFCILFHNIFVLVGKQGINYLLLHQVDAPET